MSNPRLPHDASVSEAVRSIMRGVSVAELRHEEAARAQKSMKTQTDARKSLTTKPVARAEKAVQAAAGITQLKPVQAKTINSLRFDCLTFVLNDDPDGERMMSPVNPDARLLSVSKAIAARRAATTSEERWTAAVKACARTVNPHDVAHKAQVAHSEPFLIAIKAVSSGCRECVGVVSRASVTDRQHEIVDRDALRLAADDLSARIGSSAVVIDANHKDELSDVSLKSVWFGELAPNVGDPDSLYCRFSFPAGSKTWDAVKSGKCYGFSWEGPISYAL